MVSWKKTTIGECANIVSGGTPSTVVSEFWGGDILWCTPTDITKAKNKFLSRTERTITERGLHKSAAVLLPIGTILLCSRATIGEACITTKPISTNQGFKNLVCYNHVSNEFLYYLIQTKIGAMFELAIGSTFLEISKSALASIEIRLPDLNKQRKIATILSSTDELIDMLEKLIKKKSSIKEGTVRDLLMCKYRAPGFTEKWKIKKLGELCNPQKGETITSIEIKEGNTPVVAGGRDIAYYHNKANRKPKIITISASGANAGYVNFWTCEIFASDCTTIEDSDEYDVKFVYYTLLNSQKKVYALQTGGAQPHVQPPQLKELEFGFPESITEQTTIAEIISDMDAEIDALTAKLNKLRNIKEGMMSELLTGRIRLNGDGAEDDKDQ